jgi:hypothetical protein
VWYSVLRRKNRISVLKVGACSTHWSLADKTFDRLRLRGARRRSWCESASLTPLFRNADGSARPGGAGLRNRHERAERIDAKAKALIPRVRR